MNADQAIDALANRFGILPEFRDLAGNVRHTSRETKLALLRANGLELDNDPMIIDALKRVRARDDVRHLPIDLVVESASETAIKIDPGLEWHLRLEGDDRTATEGRSDGTVHLGRICPGVHELIVSDGRHSEKTCLIAAPRAAPSVPDVTGRQRIWGINAALYGFHSARNPGPGDYEDLAVAARILASYGADFLGINPVHNLSWNDAETISPYSPSHRGFLNTRHIAADRIPGLEESEAANKLLRRSARVSNGEPALIDYAQHRRTHQRLLDELFDIFIEEAADGAKDAFRHFRRSQGDALGDFALFEAVSARLGPDWGQWPEKLRSPTSAKDAEKDKIAPDRIAFHCWLQWIADRQIANAHRCAKASGMALGLYLDLAVGPRRGGSETWCTGDVFAEGVSIGAPPDQFAPEGQNWNLAAMAPAKMAADGYCAFRDIIARNLRHCGVLRIDHILGMNRSYWLPDDGSPGGYLRQNFKALSAIVTIEAARANAIIIGEDLGLVPEGFRDAINECSIHSYSVLQFEKDRSGKFRHPDRLNRKSLACFGTHDTPTMKGYWAGQDIDWWQKMGWIDADRAKAAHRARMKEISALSAVGKTTPMKGKPSFDDLRTTVHTTLAQSPVAMMSVQLDDVFGETEAQNLPGTINEHPNWRRRCTASVETFADYPGLREISTMMSSVGRSTKPDKDREYAL